MKTLTIIAPRNEENTYIKEQYNALNMHFTVFWSIDLLWEKNHKTDYYLIHWPEYIYNKWEDPSDNEILLLSKRLDEIKTQSKIFSIVHNYYPHFRGTAKYKKLYETVYSKASGIIHLGEASVGFFQKEYPTIQVPYTIIPHPIFETYANTITQKEAREKLNIRQDDFVVLLFGALRNKTEVKLALKAFKNCKVPNKFLLVANKRLNHYQSILEKWYNYFYIKLYVGNKMLHIQSYIPNEDVQIYMNACDVVFLPRIDTLNSGVLLLGFSFGKIVVGHEQGNIGEILKQLNNPVFNPTNSLSISEALDRANGKVKDNLGVENNIYAIQNYNLDTIYNKFANFIENL